MGTRLLLAGISLCLLFGCEPPPHQPVPRAAPQKTAARLDATPQRSLTASDQKAESNRKPEYSEEDHRLVSQKDEIVSVLKNGLVVITKRVASPVVAVRGYALTGGVYEGKWLGGGLSHLLEHLVAGGSNGRRTEEQNKELLQGIGNNSNAETTEDHTVFFINTTPEHMEQAVDLVTGWMFTASITADEYRREYQVVQRELEMGKGEPDRQFFYMMQMNRYRVSPARVPVIGYQAVIQGLSRDDVYSYFKQAYVPNNMIFVVTGDLDPEKMLQAVEKTSDYPPGRVFSHNIAAEPAVTSPRAMVATFPKLGEARLNLAFPSVALQSSDMYAMDLLAAVLGQGESSILTQELRDKRRLVTGVGADDETPAYVQGSFDVMMELDADKVPEATSAALDILEQMKREPVSQDRLDRARTMLRAARIHQMQTSEDIAASLGDDFMSTGDDHFSDLYLKRLDQVTPKDLQAVARKYFDRGKLLTTALFPSEFAGSAGLPKVEDVLRPAATTQEVAQKTASESKIERVVLDNGTVLLVKRIPTSPLVVMQMYSLGGLTAEDAQTNGIGNLTMQMLLRGTKTRSAQQIAEFFDSIGGAVGAMCGNNTWAWSATSLKKNFDSAFEAYADVVNNPAFGDDQLSEMKRRVDAAIAGEDADWSAQAGRYFKKEFFGPMNSPYQFTAIGTKDNVHRFTSQQLRDWYEQKVQTAPRVLAVFGDVDPDHVKALAARLLGQGPARLAPQKPKQPSELPPPGSGTPSIKVDRVAVQKTDQQLAGVIIGFKSGSVIGDPTNYTLDVIDTLASGFTYPTGYIFETLRGLGLVYVADAHNVPGRDASLPGMFEEYAGCDPVNVNRVVELMLENTARVEGSPQDVNMAWYKRAKELMIVADAMENETPSAQAQIAAVDEVLGLGYDYHRQFADQVRQVQLSQVQSVSRQRLQECVVTISTPRPDLVQIKPGMRSWTSFPPVDLAPKGVQHDVGLAGK
ncbi:MAG TPA: pitrilysin family protein [Tepidisphaeraceae bacterium]|nr:pitrilysin family protein [Tepidisphaeraceae bacterium]